MRRCSCRCSSAGLPASPWRPGLLRCVDQLQVTLPESCDRSYHWVIAPPVVGISSGGREPRALTPNRLFWMIRQRPLSHECARPASSTRSPTVTHGAWLVFFTGYGPVTRSPWSDPPDDYIVVADPGPREAGATPAGGNPVGCEPQVECLTTRRIIPQGPSIPRGPLHITLFTLASASAKDFRGSGRLFPLQPKALSITARFSAAT